MKLVPPPAIDTAFYRESDPALSSLSDEDLIAHYCAQGRARGAIASPLALRENLLAFIPDDAQILEIGPFNAPLKLGPNVRYLDILDAGGLRRRCVEIGRDPSGVPPIIHHVGGVETVTGRYDVVLGSHSIEHQPDLVGHLRAVEQILAPGGAYVLIIPDKRYCFDHFISESTIAGVLQAWHEQRTRHTLASIIEHRALTTHNDPLRHWRGDHGDRMRDRARRVRAAIDEYSAADGRYVDVHAWYFTPPTLRAILATLNDMDLVRLSAAEIYDPAYGRNEFCAILQFA